MFSFRRKGWLWLWLWLCQRYVGRYVRRYVHRYVVRHVATSARGGSRLGPLAAGVVHPLGLCEFVVNSLVAQFSAFAVNKESQHGRSGGVPFLRGHARSPGQRSVCHAEWPAVAPIGHDEMEICAAFGGGQVRCVS